MKEQSYFQGLSSGVKSLCVGLKTTMREFFTPKITEQYPENRDHLEMEDRFRGCLTMPHNEKNEHKCIGCGICMRNCPNDTITVKTRMIETAEGKKKKVLDEYIYDQGICMYCMICVRSCPQGAITFNQDFETAVFDRDKLKIKLNNEGSQCEERKRPAIDPAKIAAARALAAKKKAAAQQEASQAVEDKSKTEAKGESSPSAEKA